MKTDKNDNIKFTRAVLIQFLLSLGGYTLIMAVVYFAARALFGIRIWLGGEPLYMMFSWINNNIFVFAGVCWLIGFAFIFYLYWRKLLVFITDIIDASDRLVQNDDEFIKLPAQLKQIEDKMNEVKQTALRNKAAAKESEQRKNDLIVYLAHDLKTPLTSVIGYLTLLRDEPQISPGLREKYLGVAADKAGRLEDLINEFFEITRFNLHEIILETGRINFSVMLRQMADEMLPIAEEKQLKIITDIPDSLIINGDSGKLARVFDNLLKNAVNYSYNKETIYVSAIDFGDSVIVKIQNTGDTIPAQKLERIFEQFFRVDTSRSSKGSGAGLGLSIARQIVELHGGTITAASVGGVTEFAVRFCKNIKS